MLRRGLLRPGLLLGCAPGRSSLPPVPRSEPLASDMARLRREAGDADACNDEAADVWLAEQRLGYLARDRPDPRDLLAKVCV